MDGKIDAEDQEQVWNERQMRQQSRLQHNGKDAAERQQL